MSDVVGRAGLPALALVLVATVLGVQAANGGTSYEPLRPADPCVAREVSTRAEGIEGLAERLVLRGFDGAACRLGVAREAFTLSLAEPGERTDAEIDALREGLLAAVTRMQAEGTLPPASDLLDEALEVADLNRFLEIAIRALPDAVVNGALKTDDVLTRAVGELDLRALLGNLTDPDELNAQLEVAITRAVEESLKARLRDLV